jgi:hypothetical protein
METFRVCISGWFSISFFSFFMEFELRASCSLGRHSTTRATPPALSFLWVVYSSKFSNILLKVTHTVTFSIGLSDVFKCLQLLMIPHCRMNKISKTIVAQSFKKCHIIHVFHNTETILRGKTQTSIVGSWKVVECHMIKTVIFFFLTGV